MILRTWAKPLYYFGCVEDGDRRTIWASAQPVTVSSPADDPYCLLVADLPPGASEDDVANGLIETMAFRCAQRCDVI